jgi:acylpyruvate hydrolase
MRLVTYAAAGRPVPGVLVGDYVVSLTAAFDAYNARHGSAGSLAPPQSIHDLLAADTSTWAATIAAVAFASEHERRDALAALGWATPMSDTSFLPPILRPGKIVCLGHNYRHHIAEMGRNLPDYPVIFAKFANTLIGHRQPIVLPQVSSMVDYEAELAIVIGRGGRDIAPEAAFDAIAGYTIFNDISVRDYQRRTIQWLQGKTFDGTGPVGPAIVTADEIADPQALDITLRLNGEVMQHSNTSDFIFDIPTIISYLSQIMTLEPGDLIATGTPSGVGFARDPQVFLRPGDVVQVAIDGLGVLENPVVAPQSAERSG